MSGPPPTPLSIRTRRGNPGKRALNLRAPKPAASRGEPPAGIALDEIALARWQTLAPICLRMGTLDEASELTLEMLCYALADLDRAAVAKREYGLTIVTPTNGEIVSPYVGIGKGAMADIRPLMAELGFAPGSRSKIMLPPAEEPTSKWRGLVKV